MIFLKDVKTFSGNFLIDDTFLFRERRAGFRPIPGRPRRRSRAGLFRPRRPATAELEESGRLITGLFQRRLRCLLSYYGPKLDGSES
jgi:hypothetical protein